MVSVAEVVEMALRGLDRSDAVYLMREADVFALAQAAEEITRKFFGDVVTFVNNVMVNPCLSTSASAHIGPSPTASPLWLLQARQSGRSRLGAPCRTRAL